MESKIEGIISRGFIAYLKKLKSERRMKDFREVFMTAFSDEVNNPDFISYVAKKFNMCPYRLIERLQIFTNGKKRKKWLYNRRKTSNI